MLIRLSDESQEWFIDVPIDEASGEAFLLQSLRESVVDFRERLLDRLAQQLPNILYESLDPGLQLPTERQMAFAIDISRVLGVAIPGDAMRYRDAMAEFIGQHVDLFRARVWRSH
jgi:hypothetical protein